MSRELLNDLIIKTLERVLDIMSNDDEYLPDGKLLRELRMYFPAETVDPQAVIAYVRKQQRWVLDIVEYALKSELAPEQAVRLMDKIRDLLLPPERRAMLQSGIIEQGGEIIDAEYDEQ